MGLTKRQRKQIKQKIKTQPLEKVARQLNLQPEKVAVYLKKIWRKEKYQKFITKRKGSIRIQVPSSLRKWLKNNWKALAFLTLFVFAVYLNSLGNDFVSDDIGAIVENKNLESFSYVSSKPLAFIQPLIYFITYKIAGLNPAPYRVTNILFHIGSSWTIYFLIGLFFSPPLPFITAATFAVHPILVEPVTWISGNPYSGSTFFIFLSFLTYLLSKAKKKKKLYFLSLVCFFLALSFSEKVVVFPLILLFYELCSGQLRKDWPKLIPFWAISGFLTLRLFGLLGARITSLETTYYQERGIQNPLIQIPIAITSYLELIFWPKNLTLYHSELTFSRLEYFFRLGIFVLLLATMGYFFKKDRRLFFWLSFFFISLLPTLTPLGISWIVAERYVYLGSLGIFVLTAWIIQKIGEIFSNKKLAYGLLAIILLALSVRTIFRNADWKNQDTLWLATAKTSPSSPQNHNNLGDLYNRRGDWEKAVEEFEKAIELKPNYGDAYHNLANTYHQVKQDDLAIENYQKALSLNPSLWQSHQNLASLYFNQKQFDLAKQNLEAAIEIAPQNLNLHLNLVLIHLRQGEKNKAKAVLEQILMLDPQNQPAKKMLLAL